MIFEAFILFVLILFPYNLAGQDAGAAVLVVTGALYLLCRRKEIVIFDQKTVILSLLLVIASIPSFFVTKNLSGSLEGMSLYLSIFMFLLVFSGFRMEKKTVVKFVYHLVLFTAAVSIVIQGLIEGVRISGNFSYGNSYALMLLFALFLGDSEHMAGTPLWKQLIIASGIIFTGSRTTFVLLMLYVLVRLLAGIRDRKLPVLALAVFGAAVLYAVKYVSPVIPVLLASFIAGVEKIAAKRIKTPGGDAVKRLNIIACIAIPVCLALFMLIPTNFRARLMNISPENGVLQERLLIFSDTFSSILKNPLGHGPNSFEYGQYAGQTAFYDVRYVHNSILQTAYDSGVISAFCLIILLSAFFVLILKEKDRHTYKRALIYLIMVGHSLLDFDFSFATILILLVLHVVLGRKSTAGGKPQLFIKALIIPVIASALIGIYSVIGITAMNAGDRYASKGDFIKAHKAYSFKAAISFDNPEVYYAIAQCDYNEATGSEGESLNALLISCRENLRKAERLNQADPRISANLAFVSGALGETGEAMKYFQKAIGVQRFNMQLYDAYYEYLMNLFKSTQEEKYLTEVGTLKKTFKDNLASLNPRARFLWKRDNACKVWTVLLYLTVRFLLTRNLSRFHNPG